MRAEGQGLLLPSAHEIDLEAALAHYAEHGYARLGVALAEEAREALRERAMELMLGRVTYEGLFFQIDTASGRYDDLTFGKGWEGPSTNYRKIEKLEKDPLFLAWIENALFERVTRALIEGGVAIYRAALFNKSAHGGTILPFHQDGGSYWGLDRDPALQIWTALDDASAEAGCLEVVPGSHHWGLATKLGGLIPEDVVRARDATSRVIALPAVAGEVILIHNYLWHRSGLNRTGVPRRGFTVCYMSATTKCLRRRRAPRDFVRVFRPESSSR